jgi:hypothetical protein
MATQTRAQWGARVIGIPPPLYNAGGLVAGISANGVVALPLGGRPATLVAGALVTALGLGLALAGVPDRATSADLYRLSNPRAPVALAPR